MRKFNAFKSRIQKISLALTIILTPLAMGQQVYWTPSSGTIQNGKANTLQLNFEGCEPEGEVKVPQSPSIDLRQTGQSSSTQIFNGNIVRKLILNFQAVPIGKADAAIPSFQVKTDKGSLTVDSARFEVVDATVGRAGAKIDEVFYSKIDPPEETIYEGEVFDMRYIIGFKEGYRINDISTPQWTPLGIVTPGLSDPQQRQFTIGGDRYIGLVYNFTSMANRSGSIQLPKARQTVSMVTGRRPGFIFDDPIVENYSIESNDLTLEVKPLPSGAPASFTGAVGAFEIESNIAPDNVQIGEPITWTLSVKGAGNWPQGIGLAPRSVAASFRSIQPDVKKEVSEESPFEGSLSEDIVLIPTKAGEYTLGPIEFTYFDPKEERYVTVAVPEKTISVNEIAQQSPIPSSQTTSDEGPTASGPTNAAPVSTAPVEIDPIGFNQLSKPVELPRDPISKQGELATAPTGPIGFAPLAIPFSSALAAWFLLAIVRSRIQDPTRPQKQAFKRLKQMAKENFEEDLEKLREWRENVRLYWNLNTPEPSEKELAETIEAQINDEESGLWLSLWKRADAVLFGPKQSIDEQWVADMRDALLSIKRPRAKGLGLFTRKAWLASAVFGLSTLFLPPETKAENEGLAAYQGADFEKAATIWSNETAQRPLDWALRHNLGLAAAQQEQWGVATAHLTAALLLNPSSDSARWNLRIALNNSPSYHPNLINLVDRRNAFAIAGRFSPAQWELIAQWAIILATLAAVIWTCRVSLVEKAKWQWLPGSIVVFGAVAYLAAQWSIDVYGDLAKPDTLIAAYSGELKSVPTDLDVEQITTDLDEGSLISPRKEFLGWMKVSLPNEEEGWARSEMFTPIYQAPIKTR